MTRPWSIPAWSLALCAGLALSLPASPLEAATAPLGAVQAKISSSRANRPWRHPAGPLVRKPLVRQALVRTTAAPHSRGGRVAAGQLEVGVATRNITPTKYETFNDLNGDATYQPDTEKFNDAGVDHVFDWQESGAFGKDLKPGKAGVDDNGDGAIDDPGEYLAAGSDDVKDPSHDNYDKVANPTGTEGDGIFQSVALAGFQGFMGDDIRPMTGVHDELTARAMVITNGDTSVILIVDDVLGFTFQFMNPVKRDLEKATGVPFNNIIMASTHTHQGPDTIGLWAGTLDYDYMTSIMDANYAAAIEAWNARVPVDMREATAHPFGCYDKATLEMKPEEECVLADYVQGNTESEYSAPYDQFILQIDLRDPWVRRMEIPVMQFVAKNGATVGSIVNFDDHPEVFLDENPLASSDFPHYVRSTVENLLGGTTLYISGTVGCQMGALRGTPIPFRDENGNPAFQPGVFDASGNPVPVWANGAENRVRSLGDVVGEYAVAAVEDAPFVPSPAFQVNSSYVDVALDNPVYKMLFRKYETWEGFEERASIIHASYCPKAGCVRTDLTMVVLGNATFMTAPGEFPPEYVTGRGASISPFHTTDPPYPDYSFPAMPGIRNAVKTPELFWVGLAQGYFGYAIPKSDTMPLWKMNWPNYYEEEYDAYDCFGDAMGNRMFEMLGSTERIGDCVANP